MTITHKIVLTPGQGGTAAAPDTPTSNRINAKLRLHGSADQADGGFTRAGGTPNMTPKREIVAAYTRVSTPQQKKEGAGLAYQRQETIALAVTKGWEIDAWYEDDDTGTTMDRPRLNDLLEDVKAGKVKHILIDRIDRWAREDLEGEQFFRKFEALGARVHSVRENFDDSFSGQLLRKIMLAFAAYDRQMLLARMTGGRKAKARTRGTYMGGHGVFGYRPIPGTGQLEIVPEEAETIRALFDLVTQGLSDRKVAKALNDAGYKTREGAEFAPATVHRIRHREPFYRGVKLLNVSVEADTPPAHEPILKGRLDDVR